MISKTISWLTFWKWKIIGTVEAADEIPSYIPKNKLRLETKLPFIRPFMLKDIADRT
jgi:hypothetical protein